MARCGCAGQQCACRIEAACGTEVTGNGSAGSPYQVAVLLAGPQDGVGNAIECIDGEGIFASNRSAVNVEGVTSTECVDVTATGSGTDDDPLIVSGSLVIAPDGTCAGGVNFAECTDDGLTVCLSGDNGNLVREGTDGGIYVDPVEALVNVQDSDCIELAVVSGTGMPGDPFIVEANPIIDPDAENLLTCGVDGQLAELFITCGILGTGTQADPLRIPAETPAQFAADFGGCDVSEGEPLYCDPAADILRGPPPHQCVTGSVPRSAVVFASNRAEVIALAGPEDVHQEFGRQDGVLVVNNPSTCRPMTYTANAQGRARIDTDDDVTLTGGNGGFAWVEYNGVPVRVEEGEFANEAGNNVASREWNGGGDPKTTFVNVPAGGALTVNRYLTFRWEDNIVADRLFLNRAGVNVLGRTC